MRSNFLADDAPIWIFSCTTLKFSAVFSVHIVEFFFPPLIGFPHRRRVPVKVHSIASNS